MELNTIIQGDCLEVMKDFDDKSVDLIVTDPPYNIGKTKEWDKWKKQSDYLDWCGNWILECQRVLKDNGSFYFFHNDMPQIAMIMEWIRQNTKFVFKQFIVWNKRFDKSKHKGFLDGFIAVENSRNFHTMAEYCLFYTFQDETGLTTVMLDTNNFPTLRKYFKDYQEALGLSLNQINCKLGHRRAEHAFYWNSTQWLLPTRETYNELAKLPLKNKFLRREYEDLRREYEDLRREYEDLRREYEDLRYVFNNQKTHHSIWNYDMVSTKRGHITPKPVNLIENIVTHSSNKGDVVLDPFIGSGTTAIACIRTNRNFKGIEISPEYCDMAKERIRIESQQLTLDI